MTIALRADPTDPDDFDVSEAGVVAALADRADSRLKAKILQIDREAAAKQAEWLIKNQIEWGAESIWFTLYFPKKVREGVWDNHDWVIAFASHREQATAELYEALVDAVCLGDVRYVRRVRGQNDEHCDRIDKIKAAIAKHNPLTKANPDA